MKALFSLLTLAISFQAFSAAKCPFVPKAIEKETQFELERAGYFERVIGQVGCTKVENPNNDEWVTYTTTFSGGKIYPHGELFIQVKVLVDTYHGMGDYTTNSSTYIDY